MNPLDSCDIEANLSYNMKRAIMPMIILRQLCDCDASICEIVDNLNKQSDGLLIPISPHNIIRRLTDCGYVEDLGTRSSANDGRRRRAYTITEKGKAAYKEYVRIYGTYTDATNAVLRERK